MNSLAKICLQKLNADAFRVPSFPYEFKHHLKKYRTNEDGAMVVLTMFFLIIFLIMASFGMAVMRHEMRRAKLTVANDAAVLACAGAPSGTTVAERKAIIEDYYAKNGLAANLNAIDTDGVGTDDIIASVNSSKCAATSHFTMNTYLLKLVGVDTLTANAAGTAQITTPKLEVSLVLDVSGSMSGEKLAALKVAAKDFVTTILDSGAPGDISISLIPFSMGVSPSDAIFNALNIDQTHTYSNCIAFLGNEFSKTAIDPAIRYRQQIYTLRNNNNSVPMNASDQFWRSCYEDAYIEILPYSMSKIALHNKIDSLVARGNTSGHLGVKWGAALLDPSFQSVATALKASGEMNNALTNVPTDWSEAATLKIIVMMGDGANTTTYYFNDPNQLLDETVPESHTLPDFRGPGSDMYMVTRNGNNTPLYYLKNPNQNDSNYNKYYDFANGSWLTETEFAALPSTLEFYETNNPNNGSALSWEMAWGLITQQRYSRLIDDYTAWNDYSNQGRITGSMKNTRMQSACTAAKNKNVVIYTIGFQVPENGTAETVLRNCAQSPSNYFPANTVNISSAFSAIASNVQNLRLTQ